VECPSNDVDSRQFDIDIELAKKGDKDAFKRLIDKYEFSLYIVARGFLKQKVDIEDALQETIIKSYKGIVNLRKNEFFKTWIIRIMINECTKILQKKKSLIYLEDAAITEDEDRNEVSQMEIMDVINSLDEDLRIVTLLFYYEDLPQKEIAQVLNIPSGTVRSRLFRAKERLRALLV
jgi:RNA polymerase sigma-70 factor, ECF subfamily